MAQPARALKPNMDAAEWAVRVDLAAAHRLAVRHDLHEGICNHMTARVRGESFVMSAWGTHWSKMTASGLQLVRGGPDATRGRSDEELVAYHIHWPVYRERPDVACVLHTHMPYATSLTMIQDMRFPICEQVAMKFAGRIAYDDEYPGRVGDLGEAEGDRLTRALGACDILIARNHGIVVVGRSVAEAYDDLYYLERCCKKLWLAAAWGKPLVAIDPAIVAGTKKAENGEALAGWAREHFEALRHVLDDEDPGYST